MDPQELWTTAVGAAAAAAAPAHRALLQRLVGYTNVPRKKAKFLNFCQSSLSGVRDQRLLGELFDAIDKCMPKKAAPAEAAAAEAEATAAPVVVAAASSEPAIARGSKRARQEATGAEEGDGDAAVHAEPPVRGEATASSFRAKKRLLALLAAAPNGRLKTKRLLRAVSLEALSCGAFENAEAADEGVAVALDKLVKRSRVSTADAKFCVLMQEVEGGGGGEE